MTKFYISLLAVLLLPGALWAQSTLTGRVTGSDEPNGLPGASVVVDGTTRGANTGPDGTYSVTLAEGDSVIVVSFIGYTRQRIAIAGRTNIDVVLPLEVNTTEEVVVVGYGTQRKSDVTGAVSSVRGEDLIKIPNNNPVQALQGKATGIQVTSGSGNPGEAPKVRVRGVGSLNVNDPLYVVDGVFMTDISAINAQDIESIEVLKDASAAAIYGVRAASGVILVTTKRGVDGKTSFSFSAEYGFQNVIKKIKLLNGQQYAALNKEIDPSSFGNLNRVSNTDWQSEIFRHNSPVQNYQFSASGGGKNSTYYFGLGYYDQQGAVDNSSYKRISVRLNNTYNLTSAWKVGTNLTIAPYFQQVARDVIATTYRADPTRPVFTQPGDTASHDKYSQVLPFGNPVADIDYTSQNYNRGFQGVGNVFTEIQLPLGLKYRFSYGIDMNYNRGLNFTPRYRVSSTQASPNGGQNNLLTVNRGFRYSTVMDNILYFNKTIDKHAIDAFVAFSAYDIYSETLGVSASNIVRDNDNLYYITPQQVSAQGASQVNPIPIVTRQLSYFGRVNYTYADKYLLTATYRVDGSSLFNKDNRYASFPSVAAGWNVSREAFLQDVTFLSNLKVRGSWGKLGNQNIPDAYRYTQYATVNTGNYTGAVFGNGLSTGATLGKTANPNIQWETTTQYDAGIEFGMFANRLTVEADLYNRNTNGILVPLQTPAFFGNGTDNTVIYNAAKVLNRGFELNLNWRDKVGKVGYRLGALGTTIYNRVLSLGDGPTANTFLAGQQINGAFAQRSPTGAPIGSFYGYQVMGVFQKGEIGTYPALVNSQAGDFKYQDTNGDGKIDGNDYVNLGSPIPKFIFGYSAGVSFAGFDLQVDFQGQIGNKILNAKATLPTTRSNYEEIWADRWTPTNPSNSVPRASTNATNFYSSSFYVQPGDFMRLRSATLSYTLPTRIAERLLLQKATVYARGTNLWTVTRYTGYTPEIAGGDVSGAGVDTGIYPVLGTYAIGINASF